MRWIYLSLFILFTSQSLSSYAAALPGKETEAQLEERRAAYSAYRHHNYKLALILFKQLAKRGDAYASFYVAHILDNPKTGQKNVAEAIKYYRIAAAGGVMEAAYNLGVIYATGEGVERDFVLAAQYYKQAADAGIMLAQSSIGQLYLLGEGVKQNAMMAYKYFHKAALQNHGYSQHQLGLMFLQGLGVNRDLPRAYAWIWLAKQNGHEKAAILLGQLEQQMSPAQLRQARALAAQQALAIRQRQSRPRP